MRLDHRWRPLLGAALLLLGGQCADAAEEGKTRVLTVGTGAPNGVYYPVGSAICRLVNRERERHGMRCLVNSSEGSVSNLNGIRDGDIDMGIAQSDWQYHAYSGTGAFKERGADKSLRALFSLYSETFTVVARLGAGVKTIDDLKGKRVNIGKPGSGQAATMQVLMAAKGWTTKDFATLSEWGPVDQAEALCNDEVDAIVYTVGHPNRSILEATTACDSVIVQVDDPAVDKLVNSQPYYAHAFIPGKMYRGNPDNVESFGVKATLVASADTPDEMVYWVVKSVFDNFDEFRKLHPTLSGLDKATMITDGNSAPLHEGALRYYREAGLPIP